MPKKIVVLSSIEIRPYVEAIEGFTEAMTGAGMDSSIEVFDLQKYTGNAEEILRGELSGNGYYLCLAVGPEAAEFASGQTLPYIYVMVLSPEKIAGPNKAVCGISLRIPVREQLEAIHRAIPDARSIGLLYDGQYNDDFFSEARQMAIAQDLDIVPLNVASKKEIPKVLSASWSMIDALWFIPDETVISESVIQYINKEALLKKVPTIGFNRFFYEYGSLISLVFDYKALGRQAAGLAFNVLAGRGCIAESPQYGLWVNERVMNRIGARVISSGDGDVAP